MKAYYVDFKDGETFHLVAGPFRSESAARKYEKEAAKVAAEEIMLLQFLEFGVVSIEGEREPGTFNDRLNIDPGDLLPHQSG